LSRAARSGDTTKKVIEIKQLILGEAALFDTGQKAALTQNAEFQPL
jgi:hypothetical protein